MYSKDSRFYLVENLTYFSGVTIAKKEYKSAIRRFNNSENSERDKKLTEVCSKEPSKFFNYMKIE